MDKRDRWLSSFAFVTALMPLLCIAFIVKILPTETAILDINIVEPGSWYASKYSNLIAGLLCIVPLSIVLITRFIKRKDKDASILPMLLVSMALSLAFTVVVGYGGIRQIVAAKDELSGFDYMGFCAVLVSVIIAVLSNVTRTRKFGNKIAVNNKFTKNNQKVWKTVHNNISTVQSLFFVLLSVILSLITGWVTFVVLCAGIVLFSGWCYFYSYLVKNRFERAEKENELVISEEK